MKYIVLLLLLPVTAFSQLTFSIKANIAGFKKNATVTLVNTVNNSVLASDTISNGAFELKGNLPAKDLYNLYFENIQEPVTVYLTGNPITITGNASSLPYLKIKGSLFASHFEEYKLIFEPLRKTLISSGTIVNTSQNAAQRDSASKVYNATVLKLSAAVNKFVTDRPGSPISTFVLVVTNEVFKDIATLEQQYAMLNGYALQTVYANQLASVIDKAKGGGAIGSKAPEFVQADTSGKNIALSSFKGKYVLIDFWASWCRPCRMENPAVVSAYNTYKDKNFTVLGVSLDQSKPNWVKAIADDKLTWTHVSDLQYWNNAVARQYKVESIPQNFLIDPNGVIVGKNLRGQELMNFLANTIK